MLVVLITKAHKSVMKREVFIEVLCCHHILAGMVE